MGSALRSVYPAGAHAMGIRAVWGQNHPKPALSTGQTLPVGQQVLRTPGVRSTGSTGSLLPPSANSGPQGQPLSVTSASWSTRWAFQNIVLAMILAGGVYRKH